MQHAEDLNHVQLRIGGLHHWTLDTGCETQLPLRVFEAMMISQAKLGGRHAGLADACHGLYTIAPDQGLSITFDNARIEPTCNKCSKLGLGVISRMV